MPYSNIACRRLPRQHDWSTRHMNSGLVKKNACDTVSPDYHEGSRLPALESASWGSQTPRLLAHHAGRRGDSGHSSNQDAIAHSSLDYLEEEGSCELDSVVPSLPQPLHPPAHQVQPSHKVGSACSSTVHWHGTCPAHNSKCLSTREHRQTVWPDSGKAQCVLMTQMPWLIYAL